MPQRDRRNAHKWSNLFLLRHGESTCNEVNRFAGMIDAPLTHLGEAQAREAARRWQGPAPEIVFTSPLQRARRTADLLFAGGGRDSAQFVVDERITERHFGDFTLKNKAFIQRETGLKGYEAALYCEGVASRNEESFSCFYQRVLTFLKEVLHPLLLAGKRVMVVAHKYVIELLCRLILRLPCGNGYDLRLPNAKILAGGELRSYVGRESHALNLLQEWLVLHHAQVLLLAGILGIALNYLQVGIPYPQHLGLALLAASTGISLARVNLQGIMQVPVAPLPFILRYVALPLALGFTLISPATPAALTLLLLLVAAPAAVTCITISRCMGGLVTPTLYLLLLSTLTGIGVMLPLLIWSGVATDLGAPAVRLLGIAMIGLGIPFVAILLLRRHFPIGTARFGERHGGTAVLLLALFVIISFHPLRFEGFWPEGAWAFLLAIGLRALALAFTRRTGLFAVDEYIAMSYPNIFFIIILAAMLDLQDLLRMATWFLLPMFSLAVFDEWLCRKFLCPGEDERLLSFLKIAPGGRQAVPAAILPLAGKGLEETLMQGNTGETAPRGAVSF